jgi:hypothetical protein
MMGAQATVRVRHRQWEGENRAEISAVEASEQAKPAASRGRQRAEESAEEETPPAPKRGGAKKRGQRGN